MADESKKVYQSPKRALRIDQAVGGRMDGLVIARVKVDGETFISKWWDNTMSALRDVAFKKRMGFSREREMKFFQTKRDED